MAKEAERVVSVTGEGIGDVEAIHGAQVGLAMGSGCSATKANAELVLTENKFSSVTAAVQWGRNLFLNCTRFLQFQLTVNISLILTIFIGIFIFSEPPMTAQMLLWINLVMDAFAAIALGTEPPIRRIVKGKPREQTALLNQRQVLRQIIGVSLWNLVIMLLTFFLAGNASGVGSFSYMANMNIKSPETNPDSPNFCPPPKATFDVSKFSQGKMYDPSKKKFDLSKLPEDKQAECKAFREGFAKKTVFTYVFNVFMFLQLFNMINCRMVAASDTNVFEKFFHNWTFIIILAICFVAQYVLVN